MFIKQRFSQFLLVPIRAINLKTKRNGRRFIPEDVDFTIKKYSVKILLFQKFAKKTSTALRNKNASNIKLRMNSYYSLVITCKDALARNKNVPLDNGACLTS